jgi:hypothetical protein
MFAEHVTLSITASLPNYCSAIVTFSITSPC